MAARKLSLEPLVRKHFRLKYEERAHVNTVPTAKGVREIDWLHDYFEVKRIERKPVSDYLSPFAGPQFVLLAKAEEEGFITSKMGLPAPPQAQVPDSKGVFGFPTASHSSF